VIKPIALDISQTEEFNPFDTGLEGKMLGSKLSGASVFVSLVAAALMAALLSAQQSTPKKITHVDPVYPEQARQMRVQGVVIVEITVGTAGRVTDARVLRSIPLLDQAALEAVKQWVYDGSGLSAPVRMTVTVPFGVSVPAVQPAPPARPAAAAPATQRAVQAAPQRPSGAAQRVAQGAGQSPSSTRSAAPNTPAAAEARLSEDSFETQGLINEAVLRGIYRGYVSPGSIDRNGPLLPALMQGYLTSFARRCSAYLPPNKVEMTSPKCATERVTRNGFGVEVSRTCVEWVDVPTGLFADPGLYAAKNQLDRPEAAANTLATLLTGNPIATATDMLSKVRGATDDMVRLVEMNACGGPGLKRFAENLRRVALNLTPLKIDGDYASPLEGLEHSRDPERFAHYLLWNMTPYGESVGRGQSFEADYTATRDTFNALAKLHGRDKMIAAAQRILSAPRVQHAGKAVLADPIALGCVENTPSACFSNLVPFLPRPGAPLAQSRASAPDRISVLKACETWAADQATKGRAMFLTLKQYCQCVWPHFGLAADVEALIADFGPALERLRTEPRYATMNQSCTTR
jgi:TonB family protein